MKSDNAHKIKPGFTQIKALFLILRGDLDGRNPAPFCRCTVKQDRILIYPAPPY